MHTTQQHANGRPRKTLAHQLDRLDAVLDGLSEGLNAAVAAAVAEALGAAIGPAVRAVAAEVLANPAVLARLGQAARPDQAPPPAPPGPAPAAPPTPANTAPVTTVAAPPARPSGHPLARLWRRGTGLVGLAATATGLALAPVCRHSRRLAQAGRAWLTGLVRLPGLGGLARVAAWSRARWLPAVGLGATAGVAVYVAGPWLTGLASGLYGLATARGEREDAAATRPGRS